MSIEDLIKHVGSENITLQNLMRDLAGVKCGKKDARIEFFTERDKGYDIAKVAALGGTPKCTPLLLWIPTDKLP